MSKSWGSRLDRRLVAKVNLVRTASPGVLELRSQAIGSCESGEILLWCSIHHP
jgi:hypothetical protein